MQCKLLDKFKLAELIIPQTNERCNRSQKTALVLVDERGFDLAEDEGFVCIFALGAKIWVSIVYCNPN